MGMFAIKYDCYRDTDFTSQFICNETSILQPYWTCIRNTGNGMAKYLLPPTLGQYLMPIFVELLLINRYNGQDIPNNNNDSPLMFC